MSAKAAVSFDPGEVRRWIERELEAERMFGCGLEVVIQGIAKPLDRDHRRAAIL